jgi:hypothetical protein
VNSNEIYSGGIAAYHNTSPIMHKAILMADTSRKISKSNSIKKLRYLLEKSFLMTGAPSKSADIPNAIIYFLSAMNASINSF